MAYHKGTIKMKDTWWIVYKIEDNEFVKVGEICLPGKLVDDIMDSKKSIKGYEPHDIAKRLASEEYPDINPVIVKRNWDRI